MQLIQIYDVKQFMQLFFLGTAFDSYELVSAELRTDMSYTIEGSVNRSFFTQEELELYELQHRTYLPWHMGKEKVYTLIKGKKTPTSLKVVLKMDTHHTASLLQGSSLRPEDISGIFLNLQYQEQELHITCGVSYNIFTMDKHLEQSVTDHIVQVLKKESITCHL